MEEGVSEITLIEISAFVHATEDFEKVLQCIKSIVPFDFKFDVSSAKGYYGNPITIINVRIKRKKEIKKILENILRKLSKEDRDRILSELDDRVDKSRFFLRFDKFEAYNGRLKLGKGIQVVFTVSTYPHRKEKVVECLRDLFSRT